MANLGGKKDSGGHFSPGDFFPSLRIPDGTDPTTSAPRPTNVVDLPARSGQNETEAGWDRWVQMCQRRAQARGR